MFSTGHWLPLKGAIPLLSPLDGLLVRLGSSGTIWSRMTLKGNFCWIYGSAARIAKYLVIMDHQAVWFCVLKFICSVSNVTLSVESPQIPVEGTVKMTIVPGSLYIWNRRIKRFYRNETNQTKTILSEFLIFSFSLILVYPEKTNRPVLAAEISDDCVWCLVAIAVVIYIKAKTGSQVQGLVVLSRSITKLYQRWCYWFEARDIKRRCPAYIGRKRCSSSSQCCQIGEWYYWK
jgi:hypothetical protein